MIFITENTPKINEGNHTNKCKSSLTSLVACNFGKVYFRIYWGGYVGGLKENYYCFILNLFTLNTNQISIIIIYEE